MDVLNAGGIPAGEILSLAQALNSSQPGLGTVQVFNLTAKFSKTPGRMEMPSPKLSEHTNAILTELGYAEEDRRTLKADKII